MTGNYKIFFISTIFSASIIVAQHFSVGAMYYYRVPGAKLFRPQMNVTNEWLSAEIFEEKIQNFLLQSVLSRIKDYVKKMDEEFPTSEEKQE